MAKKQTPKSTARRSTTKVAKRSWSLKKFSERVTLAAKKAEVPAKAISKTKIESAYNGNLTVKAAVAQLAA